MTDVLAFMSAVPQSDLNAKISGRRIRSERPTVCSVCTSKLECKSKVLCECNLTSADVQYSSDLHVG
jgi:hypothetical protein